MFTKYEFSLSDLDRATLVLSLEREAHWCREFIKEFSEDPVVIEDSPCDCPEGPRERLVSAERLLRIIDTCGEIVNESD